MPGENLSAQVAILRGDTEGFARVLRTRRLRLGLRVGSALPRSTSFGHWWLSVSSSIVWTAWHAR